MKVLALIFKGFEELEAVAPFALLRRAGIELTIASDTPQVKGSHNISLSDITDLNTIDYTVYDALLLPGGSHYIYLKQSEYVHKIIEFFMKSNRLVAAICAAPTILGMLGYLKGKKYTCFTSMDEDFGGMYINTGVVVDGNIITARSVAFAIDFAYEIIRALAGEKVLHTVWKQIYYEE